MAEAAERFQLGTLLRDKWRLDRLIGRGGMATVYAATHRNGMRGAVKVLHAELARDPEVKNRFLREGYVANAIDHPGVVKVLDDDTTDTGDVFLVMELLEGNPLDVIADQSGGRIPAARVARIAMQVIEILQAAHKAGVIHRDIKPENIFVTKAGTAKLLDFGIARLKMGDLRLTQTTSTMGTPAFMPPEQALAHWDRVDGRSDLFALGASLFNILTGAIVHPGQTPNEVLVNAATKPARPVRSIDPSIPIALSEVVDQALQFDPDDRYANAELMLAALQKALPAIEQASDMDSRPPQLATPHALGPVLPNVTAIMPSSPGTPAPLTGQNSDVSASNRPAALKTVVTMVSSPLTVGRPRNQRLIWAGIGVGGVAGAGLLGIALFSGSGQSPSVARPDPLGADIAASAPKRSTDIPITSPSDKRAVPSGSVQVVPAGSNAALAPPVPLKPSKPGKLREPAPKPSQTATIDIKPKWDGAPSKR